MKPYQIRHLELKLKIYIDESGTLFNKEGRNLETGWFPIPQKWIDNAKKFKPPTVCGYCGADLNELNEKAKEAGLCDDCYDYFDRRDQDDFIGYRKGE